MSADNWTYCPKCKAEDARDAQAAKAKALEAYGKVPAEKYMELLSQANAPRKLTETLREDYEVGVDDDGGFSVEYHCSCVECKWRFTYKHSEQVPLQENAPKTS